MVYDDNFKIDEWLKSDKGKVFINKEVSKNNIKENRFLRFEEWLKNNNFDILLYRLILEHGNNYYQDCYNKGCEPFLNNKLQFVFDYVISRSGVSVDVKEFKTPFPTQTWEFKGYYFQLMHGQGTISMIFNKDDKRCLLSI